MAHFKEARRTIATWAAEGSEIVRPHLAARRSWVCLKCPLMVKTGLVEKIFAKCVRGWIHLRHRVSIRLLNQNRLGQCGACGCPLESKLWFPLKNVKPPESERQKFDPACWLFNEQNH